MKAMKIQKNRNKYTCGTKFNLFGTPSIIIGEGLAMSYYPVSDKNNWTDCWRETCNFLANHKGWYLPSKSELEMYVEFLHKNTPQFLDKWIWTKTSDGQKAYNYDFGNKAFYNDAVNDTHAKGCMVTFYKLW